MQVSKPDPTDFFDTSRALALRRHYPPRGRGRGSGRGRGRGPPPPKKKKKKIRNATISNSKPLHPAPKCKMFLQPAIEFRNP